MTESRKGAARGFTLVELLVVIAIIGILVAMLIPAVSVAIKSAKTSTIAAELNQLAQAIENYKSKYGEYPPDFTNAPAFVNHLRKAFPRMNLGTLNLSTATLPDGRALAKLDPAEAIVFWLGMLKNNPRSPLAGPGEPVSLFDFQDAQLTCPLFPDPALMQSQTVGPDLDGDWWPEYQPKHGPGAPFVYFDGRVISNVYIYRDASYPAANSTLASSIGVVRPYRSNTPVDSTDNNRTQPYVGVDPSNTNSPNTKWVAPEKFQILCAGLDGKFTSDPAVVFKQFPNPVNYRMTDEDSDNLASFSDGRTIGDCVP